MHSHSNAEDFHNALTIHIHGPNFTIHLSVVCPSRIGDRSVWLKGTHNGSGLLPSPQPLYAIAKILNGNLHQINNFKVRRKQKKY